MFTLCVSIISQLYHFFITFETIPWQCTMLKIEEVKNYRYVVKLQKWINIESFRGSLFVCLDFNFSNSDHTNSCTLLNLAFRLLYFKKFCSICNSCFTHNIINMYGPTISWTETTKLHYRQFKYISNGNLKMQKYTEGTWYGEV